MCKREAFWVIGTLVVAAAAWIIYSMFVEEKYVDPGAAPTTTLVEDAATEEDVNEPEMDLSSLPSVGDEELAEESTEVETVSVSE